IGLPFERWLQGVARLAEAESEPDAFLAAALKEMVKQPWVSGAKWVSAASAGDFGTVSGHSCEFSFQRFSMVLYTRSALSPALTLHVKLLTRLLGNFYEAKLRERTLKQNAHTQAIYETGARLTHDVKNLLQSLGALCTAARDSGAEQAQALQSLMQRQLPMVEQRLRRTLENLQAPQQESITHIAAEAWWAGLKQRYIDARITFLDGDLTSSGAIQVPQELLDSVADNLLQNALRKSTTDANLLVRVTFCCGNGPSLTVCDSGTAMGAALTGQLFNFAVPSKSGLGVGLYQAAQQARQLGYRLTLDNNENGRVCFVCCIAS
ncbi:MAG: sensor histidine kinase, partial [Burkholderiales bacterium]